MSELRVPTVPLDVEVLCADGRSFVGRIFLPAAASSHPGAMRPEEWMNDQAPFFPFLAEGADRSVILNKHEVLVLTILGGGLSSLAPSTEGEPEVPRRRVSIEVRGRVLDGTVVIDMPVTQSRVADYLNRPAPFLALLESDRRHLVRKARISRIIEQREE